MDRTDPMRMVHGAAHIKPLQTVHAHRQRREEAIKEVRRLLLSLLPPQFHLFHHCGIRAPHDRLEWAESSRAHRAQTEV